MLKQAYHPFAADLESLSRPGVVVLSYDPAFGNGDSPHYGL